MKVLILVFILTQTCVQIFASTPVVAQANINVVGVRFDRNEINMLTGDTVRLTARIDPDNATNTRLIWRLSENGIVNITQTITNAVIVTNNLQGIASGVVTVTATSEDGNRVASCRITVGEPLRSINLDHKEATLVPNGEMILNVSFTPRNVANRNVTWQSTSPDVASVIAVDPATTSARDPQARITGHKEGETRIIVRSDENSSITAYCAVTVSQGAEPVVTGNWQQPSTVSEVVQTDPLLETPVTDPARVKRTVNPYVIAGVVVLLALVASALFYQKKVILSGTPIMIKAVSGHFSGQTILFVKNRLVIGRDPQANLVYPVSNQKISRIHCIITYDPPSNSYILIDSSTNGTFFANGEKLESGKPYVLKSGDKIYLANQEELFEI